ncbi:MAG: hypothetical protein J7K39_05745 [Bacteroidales bacterium]|nr:hypothetical protein [Bacteroidales bacterium]
MNSLSKRLTEEFGKGFSSTNIKQIRSFYLTYSKGQTLSDEFKLFGRILPSKEKRVEKYLNRKGGGNN